ncbi:cytochrome c553 [Chitinivorax tropicus]|uniref:Cytochrome c553 n=1 Tax=Chitinivorax tropicus TaxID=714531 RepID=A0A840MM69_9PROT|nr:c-type cytochrome [Chitinivorax tropicus]MBB5018017.1 cytochrome c553 [Chitinivorax tropicus]
MKFRMVAFIIAGLAASGAAVAETKADPAKGQQIVQQVCVACHGADGNSSAPINPNLAGQHPEYLFKQLKAFKENKLRKNPTMFGMTATLTEDDMRNVSAYLSQQKPKVLEGSKPDLQELGKKIYKVGNPATGLPACAACHGPKGGGMPAQFPRLGGQHAEYTITQLNAFRKGERANDPGETMRQIALKMTDKEIEAVSNYLVGLR